ncbi:hypothetical protein HYH02_009698 [Chlamydomonas schloesseri]|uniref:Uncharacterized protein n=1 Tax=Chlamydomonas schloesseri TaxID=2026947 RepID=A0A835W8Z6_9CHLO|nr:hypothetical protein HYH02_009698 [Chlamydomonas schloesseri]|eukprot:KAG2442214.1 hypothetical protein HYH02_009698 [Chlamydomonas schloesseri]
MLSSSCHDLADAHEQWLMDRMKEAAAVRKGLHVARLHVVDMVWCEVVVSRTLSAARIGLSAQVHYTNYYL